MLAEGSTEPGCCVDCRTLQAGIEEACAGAIRRGCTFPKFYDRHNGGILTIFIGRLGEAMPEALLFAGVS